MITHSFTSNSGEVFNANWNTDNNGWYVDKNGSDHVFVPYSKSFEINRATYMATTIQEALRLGIHMIELNAEAFANFEKSHPELNP